MEIYFFTSVPMVVRWKLFFAQSFLSINSVSSVKSKVSAKQAQGDLLLESNRTPSRQIEDDTPALSIEIPAQENLLQKHKKA